MKQVLLLSALFAIGCTPKVVYVDKPVEVRVPVPVPCPEPPKVPRPVLKPVDPEATPQEVAEAALRSMVMVMGYADQLEVLLEAYRKPSEKK